MCFVSWTGARVAEGTGLLNRNTIPENRTGDTTDADFGAAADSGARRVRIIAVEVAGLGEWMPTRMMARAV